MVDYGVVDHKTGTAVTKPHCNLRYNLHRPEWSACKVLQLRSESYEDLEETILLSAKLNGTPGVHCLLDQHKLSQYDFRLALVRELHLRQPPIVCRDTNSVDRLWTLLQLCILLVVIFIHSFHALPAKNTLRGNVSCVLQRKDAKKLSTGARTVKLLYALFLVLPIFTIAQHTTRLAVVQTLSSWLYISGHLIISHAHCLVVTPSRKCSNTLTRSSHVPCQTQSSHQRCTILWHGSKGTNVTNTAWNHTGGTASFTRSADLDFLD